VTRVYVPVTRTELHRLVAEHALPGPLVAHAVTADLRDAWPDGDEEQWEYAALMAAAGDSWSRRSADDPPRRFVVAADVRRADRPDDGSEGTTVTVADGLTWGSVAAFHADPADLPAALVGDPDGIAGEDLAWYAVQEAETLL
jgi:Family of unknown function (DUF6912)